MITYIDFIDLYSAAIGEATQGPKEVAPIVKEGYLFKRGELWIALIIAARIYRNLKSRVFEQVHSITFKYKSRIRHSYK